MAPQSKSGQPSPNLEAYFAFSSSLYPSHANRNNSEVGTRMRSSGLAENSLPDRSFECNMSCVGDRDSRARDDRKDSRRPFELFWPLILESCVGVLCTNIGLGAGF